MRTNAKNGSMSEPAKNRKGMVRKMKELMLGNAAVARGAYEAGAAVVASYPGTPSTEITENIVQYNEIYAEWSPNEKVAAEVAIGASIGGARSMSCMKHVGMNVMADPDVHRSAIPASTAAWCFCVADDPGHALLPERAGFPALRQGGQSCRCWSPQIPQECKEFHQAGLRPERGIRYARSSARLSTRISHSQSLVELVPAGRTLELKPYEKNIAQICYDARQCHASATLVVEERTKKLAEYAETTALNTVEINSDEIGVITSGAAYMYAKEALGDQVSFLKLGMVYPLPDKKILDFAGKHKKIYVIEELDPVFEEHIRALGIDVIGKEKFTMLGEYTPAMIRSAVLGWRCVCA